MGRAAQLRRPAVPVSQSGLPAAHAGTPDPSGEQADEPQEGDDRGHDEQPVDDEARPERGNRDDCENE